MHFHFVTKSRQILTDAVSSIMPRAVDSRGWNRRRRSGRVETEEAMAQRRTQKGRERVSGLLLALSCYEYSSMLKRGATWDYIRRFLVEAADNGVIRREESSLRRIPH